MTTTRRRRRTPWYKRPVSDRSIKKAFEKALSNDNRVTANEIGDLLDAVFDKGKVTRRERRDLYKIAESGRCETNAIVMIFNTLQYFNKMERIDWSYRNLKLHYGRGRVPKGWRGSAYDKDGFGSCAVKLSLALKRSGYLTFGRFPHEENDRGRRVWPKGFAKRGLPVNAKDLMLYLQRVLGIPQRIDVSDPTTSVRQGILFVDGFKKASGHIGPWDGAIKMFEDGNDFMDLVKDPRNTSFWDLRPDWLIR